MSNRELFKGLLRVKLSLGQMKRKHKVKPPNTRGTKWLYPNAIERRYYRIIREWVRVVPQMYLSEIQQFLPRWTAEFRADGFTDE